MTRARFRAAAAAAPIAAPDQERDGRWAIYTGGEMVPHTAGINDGKPCRIVLDLAGVAAPTGRVIALADHSAWSAACVLGSWDGWSIDGGLVAADLHITRPASDAEAGLLATGLAIAAHLRASVPLGCSIGVEWEPADAERVPASASISVNGRAISGDGDLPLFVIRRSRICEASIVPFGADADARRIAAAAATPTVTQDQPMADDATPPKADDSAIAKAAEAITAAAAAITAAAAKFADITVQPPPAEKREPDGDEAKAAAAKAGKAAATGVAFATGSTGGQPGAPATLVAAMAQIQRENPSLRGSTLHAAACARWPALAPRTCIARKA